MTTTILSVALDAAFLRSTRRILRRVLSDWEPDVYEAFVSTLTTLFESNAHLTMVETELKNEVADIVDQLLMFKHIDLSPEQAELVGVVIESAIDVFLLSPAVFVRLLPTI